MGFQLKQLKYYYKQERKRAKILEKEAKANGNYIEAIEMNFAISMYKVFLKDLYLLSKAQRDYSKSLKKSFKEIL